MLHHISFTADDPRGVAEIMAKLIGGKVSRFGPWPGGYIAWSTDTAGTAIEIYPTGTEMAPDTGDGQANFSHNYFAQKHTATHAAVSVDYTEDEVRAIANDLNWRAVTLDRGGFDVIELWVENRVMLEILTPAMLAQYLEVVNAPRIAASGDEFDSISLSVTVNADCATAFTAWTDPAALRRWWSVAEAHIDLRVGGPYELLFLPEEVGGYRGMTGCKVLSYVPDRMLSFSWNTPGHLSLHQALTWVVLTFSEAPGGGTTVELTQCGFLAGPEWEQCQTYFRQAWKRVMRRFGDHFELDVDLTRLSQAVPQPSVQIG